MKILLCLLSQQHVPNLLSVHHFRPDRLVLLESEYMEQNEAANKLLKALKLGGLDYHERSVSIPLSAEDNLTQIREALEAAHAHFPDGDWIANITGGTKPMSIGTYEFFKERGARLVYTNVARPYELLDIDGNRKSEECKHRPSVQEFLAGYGFESKKEDDKLREAEERADSLWDCARTLVEHSDGSDLLTLENKQRSKLRNRGLTLTGELTHPSAPIREAVRNTFGLDADLHGKLDKHAGEFLSGGFLEVFLWGLLQRYANRLGIWDVRLGIEPGPLSDESRNDFDISFIHDYNLCMIECKSGAQKHDPKLDVLYKIEAVVRQFRALRVKSWLALTSDVGKDVHGNIRENIQSRAVIYGCRILKRERIEALARESNDVDLLRATLFEP